MINKAKFRLLFCVCVCQCVLMNESVTLELHVATARTSQPPCEVPQFLTPVTCSKSVKGVFLFGHTHALRYARTCAHTLKMQWEYMPGEGDNLLTVLFYLNNCNMHSKSESKQDLCSIEWSVLSRETDTRFQSE